MLHIIKISSIRGFLSYIKVISMYFFLFIITNYILGAFLKALKMEPRS
jgi:hypothetical protein